MTDSQTNPAWDLLLDLSGPGSLHRRLTSALRDAITTGRLPEGTALPSSRSLAADLGCSRWSVTEAYAQLVAEGYLEARVGSATRVRWTRRSQPVDGSPPPTAGWTPRWDLAPGLPDVRAFPRRAWADALRRVASAASNADLAQADPLGHAAVRSVLADYLRRVRGAELGSTDVVVTTSVTAGVSLVCRALATDGATAVAVEDPGWTQLHDAIRSTGLALVPIGVDEDGLRIEELATHPEVRAVVATPAHQFPRGVVLAPHRRAALLDWARRTAGVVLEDDYDAEFRYDGRAVGSLQGMDPSRVFLAGSLTKTLSPALGIGWLAVPGPWRAAVAAASTRPAPPTLDQLAFADLITSGRYDRHLRGRRQAFRRRREALVVALKRRLPDCQVSGMAAGLHLTLALPAGTDAVSVVRRARRRGLRVSALDSYRVRSGPPGSDLVLGYGNLADHGIDDAVEQLGAAVPD